MFWLESATISIYDLYHLYFVTLWTSINTWFSMCSNTVAHLTILVACLQLGPFVSGVDCFTVFWALIRPQMSLKGRRKAYETAMFTFSRFSWEIPCVPEIVLSVRGSINQVRYKLESAIISHFKAEIGRNSMVNNILVSRGFWRYFIKTP